MAKKNKAVEMELILAFKKNANSIKLLFFFETPIAETLRLYTFLVGLAARFSNNCRTVKDFF